MLDTLLKQNIAVLAVAIFGALALSLLMISGLVLRPQMERSAADMAQMIQSLELSFQQMDPFQQAHFAEALRAGDAMDVVIAARAPDDARMQHGWFVRQFVNLLDDQYAIPTGDVLVDINGRVWVRIDAADQPYWLSLRALPVTDPVFGPLLGSGIALLAALAGGIALQRRIALPLKRLEKAVGRMSSPTDIYDSDITHPREIAAVSGALKNMSTRLQAAEADRAMMLAGVSHDLRTPLTKLRLMLAMLKNADAELIHGAEASVIRIETMLGQFLDFARGFEAEDTRALPLRTLMQQAIECCADPAAVALDAPSDVMVRVKEAALLRAVDNLLANAMRYGKPPVVLAAYIVDASLVVEVRDAGRGISAQEARDLIRPFARGNVARAGEGTGLGLAIVDQVAKAHGGSITFAQEETGFVARLSLPRAHVV